MKKKSKFDDNEYKSLSEGQLIFYQFFKHRVGVVSLFVLLILYIIVIFADFFSPYGMLTNHKKLLDFDSVEGIGIILFCLIVIVFGPIAKLLAYGGIAWGLYKVYKGLVK